MTAVSDWPGIYTLLRLDRELWDIAPPPGWSVSEQRFIRPGEEGDSHPQLVKSPAQVIGGQQPAPGDLSPGAAAGRARVATRNSVR